MQAVILAGGKGTRLNPYTAVLPKPLVPVGDYPILEIIIKQLKFYGISELIISTGHLAELIEAYFRDGRRWGIKIRYVREDKPLNTAGALGIINSLDDNFLVMNGDILTTLNYKELFKFHLSMNGIATVAIIKRRIKDNYGVIQIDDENCRLTDYIEKPVHSYFVSMGINILNLRCKDYINKNESIGMPELFLRMMKNKEKICCYKSKDYWLDIGRIEDYNVAQDIFLNKRNRFFK
jgi:NDP-sugar pyrophosphorylase family protein